MDSWGHGGSVSLLLTSLELIERLAAPIPPPRRHRRNRRKPPPAAPDLVKSPYT